MKEVREDISFTLKVREAVDQNLEGIEREALLLRHADYGPHPYSNVAAELGVSEAESHLLARNALIKLRRIIFDQG